MSIIERAEDVNVKKTLNQSSSAIPISNKVIGKSTEKHPLLKISRVPSNC